MVEHWLVAKRLPPLPARNLKSAPRPGACGPLPEGLAGGKTDAGCACGWMESLAPKFPCWVGCLGQLGATRVRMEGLGMLGFWFSSGSASEEGSDHRTAIFLLPPLHRTCLYLSLVLIPKCVLIMATELPAMYLAGP